MPIRSVLRFVRRAVLPCAGAAALAGCSLLDSTTAFHVNPVAKPYNTPRDTALGFDKQLIREPFDIGRDCLPGLGAAPGSVAGQRLDCDRTAVEAIVDEPDAVRARIARNRLQDHLIYLSNDVCDIHKAAMFAKITSVDLGLGLAAVGLGAASTIVTAVDGTRILAGLAAAATGSRATVNETLIQNQLVTTLTRAIDNERKNLRTDIDAAQAKALDAYTVERSIADVILYHEKCSIYAALAALDVAAEDIKTRREEYLQRAKDFLAFANEVTAANPDGTPAAAEAQNAADAATAAAADEVKKAALATD